jgi:hypothetical protein
VNRIGCATTIRSGRRGNGFAEEACDGGLPLGGPTLAWVTDSAGESDDEGDTSVRDTAPTLASSRHRPSLAMNHRRCRCDSRSRDPHGAGIDRGDQQRVAISPARDGATMEHPGAGSAPPVRSTCAPTRRERPGRVYRLTYGWSMLREPGQAGAEVVVPYSRAGIDPRRLGYRTEPLSPAWCRPATLIIDRLQDIRFKRRLRAAAESTITQRGRGDRARRRGGDEAGAGKEVAHLVGGRRVLLDDGRHRLMHVVVLPVDDEAIDQRIGAPLGAATGDHPEA